MIEIFPEITSISSIETEKLIKQLPRKERLGKIDERLSRKPKKD